MKDLAILSSELFFLILVSLQKPQQNICSYICFALVVVDLKMVLEEILSPTDLSEAQALCIYEATKVVVVCKDQYFVLAAFQIVTPYLKDFDNSKKLALMGLVSSLYRNHFSQKKRYQVALAQIDLDDYFVGITSGS